MARNEGSHSINPTQDPATATTSVDPDANVRHADRHHRSDRMDEHRLKPAKTSAAAVFALVFGLSALLSVLTVILAPLALALSLVGIVLGFVGMKMAKRVGVTGKGVAIGGLVLSIIALLLAITAAVGVTTFLNNESAVDRLERQVQKLRDDLPSDVEVPQP